MFLLYPIIYFINEKSTITPEHSDLRYLASLIHRAEIQQLSQFPTSAPQLSSDAGYKKQ